MSGWDKELAYIWTNNVAPSRPSCSEMYVYTKYLRKLQTKNKTKRLSLLVLGSTPEFRDWGVEENLDISVVDKSENYYNTISREIRHKNIKETLYVTNWEDMHFKKSFDIIVGDLSLGNIKPSRFKDFIHNVNDALVEGGLFLGKSFLWREEESIKTPKQIIEDYNKMPYLHPYTFINHQLALYCLDRKEHTIDFSKMYSELERLYKSGILNDEIFSHFKDVGWNTEMKFKFYAPPQDYFIKEVNKIMKFIRFEHTDDIYTDVFPIYVVEKLGG